VRGLRAITPRPAWRRASLAPEPLPVNGCFHPLEGQSRGQQPCPPRGPTPPSSQGCALWACRPSIRSYTHIPGPTPPPQAKTCDAFMPSISQCPTGALRAPAGAIECTGDGGQTCDAATCCEDPCSPNDAAAPRCNPFGSACAAAPAAPFFNVGARAAWGGGAGDAAPPAAPHALHTISTSRTDAPRPSVGTPQSPPPQPPPPPPQCTCDEAHGYTAEAPAAGGGPALCTACRGDGWYVVATYPQMGPICGERGRGGSRCEGGAKRERRPARRAARHPPGRPCCPRREPPRLLRRRRVQPQRQLHRGRRRRCRLRVQGWVRGRRRRVQPPRCGPER
jgi:hypothetical protein